MVVMLVWIVMMVAGNVVSGYLSDLLFKKTPSGRVVLGTIVVFLSAILIYFTMYSPTFTGFLAFGMLTAFEIPMAGPSVNAAVMDITVPELRGSATAYLNFFSSAGSTVGPFLGGILGAAVSLKYSITLISSVTWIICGILFAILIFTMPGDVRKLRGILKSRGAELDGLAQGR